MTLADLIPRMTAAVVSATARVKAVDATREEYERRIDALVRQSKTGANRDELDRALRDIVVAIALLMLIRGLRDGGVDYEALETDERLDVDAIMATWLAGQLVYVGGFAEVLDSLDELQAEVDRIQQGIPGGTTTAQELAVAQAALSAAEADVERRVALWVASGVALHGAAYANAQADQMGTWRMDPNKDHCKAPADAGRVLCSWLDGQRHRLSWFMKNGYVPREPGSKTLQCGGFHCGCGVYSDLGIRIL